MKSVGKQEAHEYNEPFVDLLFTRKTLIREKIAFQKIAADQFSWKDVGTEADLIRSMLIRLELA